VLEWVDYENAKHQAWRESKLPVKTAAMFLIGMTNGRPVCKDVPSVAFWFFHHHKHPPPGESAACQADWR
jgi:hypothetical protein